MSAQIISGRDIAAEIRSELTARVSALIDQQGVVPGLATVLVGDDPASHMYVGMKNKAAGKMGIHSRQITLPADTSEAELLGLVAGLNADPQIHGILVQLPLPDHIDEGGVIEAIDPSKDVDGFHPISVGRLATDSGVFFPPCTPAGVIEMLVRSGHDPAGKHVVVVGRSNIVGRPLASLLIRKAPGGNATVTVCHSRTPDLGAVTRSAEILVVAIGRPEMITADMVRPGAVVIDVGSHRIDDPGSEKGYRLCGDVLFDEVKNVAGALSPSPGGVGPMTITMLLSNTVESAARAPACPEARGALSEDLRLDLFDEEPEEATQVGDDPPKPPAEEPRVWTVSQVNRAVRSLLESTVDSLWVGGEVGNWTRSRAGHCYFTLKDDRAQLRCVLWRSDAERLPTDPEEGMQVRVFGALTLYEARGEYQMGVQRLEAEGAEGLWRLAFEKLRAKLEKEGLLDPARKRALPRFPATVGVVTSATGAALRDILTVLRRRAPWVRVIIRGTRVQGGGASREIARALRALGESGLCNVIIVGRGGGSLEDLWAFNEEPVARAIVGCPVPVISAVGHEVDTTISDLVADLRAPTPSSAAEAVTPDRHAVLRQLREVPARLARGLRGTVERRRGGLVEGLHRLGAAMERRLAPGRQAVDLGAERLERRVRRLLEIRRGRLETLAGRLHALSPLAILERGYSVASTREGRVLRRVEDFAPGRSFLLRVADGTVAAESAGPMEEDDE